MTASKEPPQPPQPGPGPTYFLWFVLMVLISLTLASLIWGSVCLRQKAQRREEQREKKYYENCTASDGFLDYGYWTEDWTKGLVVECTGMGYYSTYAGAPAGTVKLVLTTNELTHVRRFEELELRVLDLANNWIAQLEPKTFDRLYALEKLNLGSNLLTSLPPDIFAKNERLVSLTLYGNSFDETPSLVSPSLRALNLEVCKLRSFNSSNLEGLPELESLNLRGNLLKTLEPFVFLDSVSLDEVGLHWNHWECSCENALGFDALRKFRLLDEKTVKRPVQCRVSSSVWKNFSTAGCIEKFFPTEAEGLTTEAVTTTEAEATEAVTTTEAEGLTTTRP